MSSSGNSKSFNQFVLWAVVLNLGISIFILVWNGLHREKVVYVDSVKLMRGYKGMEDAKKEFTAKTETWQANLDTLRKEAEVVIKQYEATKAKASARERELMESLIESKQQQYSAYEQNIREQVQRQDQELSQKVLAKVNDYIKRHGKAKGYSFIMAATQYGNIVYAETSVDITEEVLAGLNAEYGYK